MSNLLPGFQHCPWNFIQLLSVFLEGQMDGQTDKQLSKWNTLSACLQLFRCDGAQLRLAGISEPATLTQNLSGIRGFKFSLPSSCRNARRTTPPTTSETLDAGCS